MLCALPFPPRAGTPCGSTSKAVYQRLSPTLRGLCEQLTAHHAPGPKFIAANRRIMGDEIADIIAEHLTGADHPLGASTR